MDDTIEWQRLGDGDFAARAIGWTATVFFGKETGLWSWSVVVDGPVPGASRIAHQGYAKTETVGKAACERILGGPSHGN